MDLYAGSTSKQAQTASSAQGSTNLVIRGKLTARDVTMRKVDATLLRSKQHSGDRRVHTDGKQRRVNCVKKRPAHTDT